MRWDSERELLLRWCTSKYSLLLNIQHEAGCRQTRQWRREWTWPRGITVSVRRFSHAPICCNGIRFGVILPEYDLTTGEFLILTPSLGWSTANIAISNISLKKKCCAIYFCRREFRYILSSTTFTQCALKATSLWNNAKTAITSFKVIQGHQFWYQSKAHRRSD